jgi:two-component system sensor histidine kinase TctE
MVESVNDRILGAASRAIAESLTVDSGEISLKLSPAIFGMLESNARDNVYYSVRHRGRLLTGYADLPVIAGAELGDTEVAFGKGTYLGRPIRIVAEARTLPEIDAPVIIQVAETLDARDRIAKRMLLALALLEITLIGVAAVLVPLAVRWGLKPVGEVREEMDRRAASDLAPLSLHRVPRELRDLVRAFNTMLGRLDAAMQGMRRFTADASHQMRTPLSILRTHIAALRQASPGSEAARISLDDIDHASERLGHLLVQLLALAKADAAGPGELALDRVDLNAVAEAAAAERVPDALRAGVDLSFAPTDRPCWAQSHSDLARELVANLIDNAVRYNRSGGRVHVLVEDCDGTPTIAIEDDGPGIAEADRERVFTRFTRLESGRRTQGSGLGLPIARSLATAIGAVLTLGTPRDGKGLRAEVGFASG